MDEQLALVFSPNLGERRAINNGAPVEITVQAEQDGSAKIAVEVGDPPEDGDLKAQYPYDVVSRAFAGFQFRLAEKIKATGQFGFTREELASMLPELLARAQRQVPTAGGNGRPAGEE